MLCWEHSGTDARGLQNLTPHEHGESKASQNRIELRIIELRHNHSERKREVGSSHYYC